MISAKITQSTSNSIVYIYYVKKPGANSWDDWSMVSLESTEDPMVYNILMLNKKVIMNSIIYETKSYYHDNVVKYFAFDITNNIAKVIDTKLYKKFQQL